MDVWTFTPAQGYATSMRRLTHEQYTEALALAHPSYELKSQYINGRSKVKVCCHTHGKTYDVIARSLTTSGQGLKCCGEARQKKARGCRVLKAKAGLAAQIASCGRVTLVSADGYKSNRSKVLCRCNNCGEEHKAEAANVCQGQGLDCSCRLELRRASGKTAWSIELVQKAVNARQAAGWSNPFDSVESALRGDVLPGTCDLYLYESPVPGLSKFGIAKDVEKRARQDGYGKSLIPPRPYVSRVDAILIEQAYKYSYSAKPPGELAGWCGRSELTDATPDEFLARIEELETALADLGREAFAAEYTGYRD